MSEYETRGRPRKHTQHYDRVRKLLGEGFSVREIAGELGIPKSTVMDIKKRIEL